MSKYIDEVITDIKECPDEWVDYHGNGIRKDNIMITGYGNTALLSVIHVFIDGKDMSITYIDHYKLERAVGWWYKNVKLKTILK